MSEALAPGRRDAAAAWALTAAALALMAAGMTASRPATAVVGAAVLALAAVVVARPVLPWSHLLVALVLVILFIPIRRYTFPGKLPFQLEPYRVLVAFLIVGWVAALLVDRRVRLRRSGLEGPIFLIVFAVAASIAVNPERVSALQPTVLKAATFFLSFVIVFYLVVSVVTDARRSPTRWFGPSSRVGPWSPASQSSRPEPDSRRSRGSMSSCRFSSRTRRSTDVIQRGGAVRAFGPAEHPIALGAALVMLLPLAIYLVRTGSPRWWFAVGTLVIGTLSTVSRTGIVMLAVVGLVFLWLWPRETKRLWPLLIPILVVTHFAAPGTLGSLTHAFLPEDGLVAQQRDVGESCDAGGRIADIGPTLDQVANKPFVGFGFGTRITTGVDSNACVLDDQWLGTIYEVGAVGALAWLWLFLAALRRLGGWARRHDTPEGWLVGSAIASVTAYAVGMATFDALGFTQVTFLLFVILALAAAVWRSADRPTGRPLAASYESARTIARK